MSRALHAEWTKLRTLPATLWLALAIVALTVAASAAATASVDVSQCASPCFEDTAKLSLGGVRLGQVAAVALAVLAIGGEYGSGTIHATLAASPRRVAVVLAKAAVVAAIVLAAATVAVAGSLAAGHAILPGTGFAPPSLGEWATLRAAAGTVLYLVLVALLAVGVGVVVRDSTAAVAAVLGVLFVTEPVAELVVRSHERIQQLAPMPAGLAVQATERLDRLPIGPWAGLGVLAAYAAAALLAGGLLVARRDA